MNYGGRRRKTKKSIKQGNLRNLIKEKDYNIIFW